MLDHSRYLLHDFSSLDNSLLTSGLGHWGEHRTLLRLEKDINFRDLTTSLFANRSCQPHCYLLPRHKQICWSSHLSSLTVPLQVAFQRTLALKQMSRYFYYWEFSLVCLHFMNVLLLCRSLVYEISDLNQQVQQVRSLVSFSPIPKQDLLGMKTHGKVIFFEMVNAVYLWHDR
jgi:hypothetical protein